ncbi:MAG: NolF secretion protein [Acidobacteria bacterium]|nr:NolF secretion protein [Acidobacteriota bacterium]
MTGLSNRSPEQRNDRVYGGIVKRLILPLFGIIILILSVAQVKAMRQPHGAAGNVSSPSPGAVAIVSAEGRLTTYPGSEVTVGSDVAGTIERLAVQEKDTVHKGQIVATIKADDTRAARNEAKARVGEAEADIRLYELEQDRARSLWNQDVGSRQSFEKADRDLDAARARRASAVAEVRRLDALLAKTVIVVPIDGVVVTREVHPGETIAAGAALLTIADLRRTRIEAEVDEYDGGRVRLGAPVTIASEGYEGQWRGTVEEIPDSVTSLRLKPQDPSKPIDTRVLLVKVALGEPLPVKLGQRVEVKIATR